ncbi:MAG: MBL fold metallo-hydrolase [Alphaproteobacteria bacterium]|nr:MBL fold metallo-hydrolase [Alphaproteobacteria bacterium]
MKITVLGCGSSLGVPALGHGWGDCDPLNQKNRRTRSSIFIDYNGSLLLVDTSPDLREQFLTNNIAKVDAVLLTHFHYDHVNGINELRPILLQKNEMIDVYATSGTLEDVSRSFFYLFQRERHDIYRQYLNLKELTYGNFDILNIRGICFPQNHGFSTSLGFRIDNFAYSTDVMELSDEMVERLQNLDVWMVDCLCRGTARATHANLDTVLRWIDIVKPYRAFLTHMDTSMDYDYLCHCLPRRVRPAYDHMQIKI